MIRFMCPSCNEECSADLRLAGTNRTCEKCGVLLQIPEGIPADLLSLSHDRKAGKVSRPEIEDRMWDQWKYESDLILSRFRYLLVINTALLGFVALIFSKASTVSYSLFLVCVICMLGQLSSWMSHFSIYSGIYATKICDIACRWLTDDIHSLKVSHRTYNHGLSEVKTLPGVIGFGWLGICLYACFTAVFRVESGETVAESIPAMMAAYFPSVSLNDAQYYLIRLAALVSTVLFGLHFSLFVIYHHKGQFEACLVYDAYEEDKTDGFTRDKLSVRRFIRSANYGDLGVAEKWETMIREEQNRLEVRKQRGEESSLASNAKPNPPDLSSPVIVGRKKYFRGFIWAERSERI